MKLLTKAIEAKLPALGSQMNNPDPMVVAKFFCPWNTWTWFATEYEPETGLFFGLVVGHDTELGYFSMADLQSVKHWSGLRIERDKWFAPTKLSAITKNS